jgi:hypothetical protein
MNLEVLFRLSLSSVAVAFLSGCAALAPYVGDLVGGSPTASIDVHTQTAVRLEEGNFIVVRTNVVGSSKGFRLLGFITLYPATLNEAMNRLYSNAEGQEGRPETLAHLIVEHSGIYVILFSIPRITARADLVEFVPSVQPEDNGARTFGVHQRR